MTLLETIVVWLAFEYERRFTVSRACLLYILIRVSFLNFNSVGRYLTKIYSKSVPSH